MLDLKEYGIVMWDAEKIASFRRTLLDWYDREKRDLPWRRTKNPYYIWVSEIMLQQTQVQTVIPYYERFLDWFPTVKDLAEAPEEKLLKAWEGLGYYSRVRNMQKAAQQIMDDFNGQFPDTYDNIAKLKGIGPYTAGAISSIAFGLPEPAVDGNVMRVMARLFEVNYDIGDAKNRKIFQAIMDILIDPDRPGDFNQALMELGAVICVPNGQAKCAECPTAFTCLAHRHDKADMIPVKSPKKARTQDNRTVFIIQDGECTAIRKRPEKGLLAGLYELPNTQGHLKSEDALLYVKELGLDPLYIEELPPAKHIFSHIEWRMQAYRIKVSSLKTTQDKELIFVSKEQSGKQYAIPSAFGAYAKYIKEETR